MQISDAGIALIKQFEGCELKAYPDPATGGDPWTIGVGHTGADVKPGLVITDERAEELLRKDLEKFERAVEQAVGDALLEQQQFDACVSLAFNIGGANFRSSTLVSLLKEGDTDGAAQQFVRWNKAAGKVMAGLTRRREAERDLFLS
jgi:lysozyme